MPRVTIDLPNNENLNSDDIANPLVQQHFFRKDEIEYMENRPDEHLKYRKKIEAAINRGFGIFYKDTEASRMAEWYMKSEMIERLRNHSELTERLIPK